MGERPRSERTRVRREPKRGVYDRETIDAILDEGLVCHLGFVHDGQPYVIPTLYGRVGDDLYVHGSSASRMLRTLESGLDACLTVTLVDGVVLARSIFNHSINYRSVIVLGHATAVTDETDKLDALEALAGRLLPGRWADVRPPRRPSSRRRRSCACRSPKPRQRCAPARRRTTMRTTSVRSGRE